MSEYQIRQTFLISMMIVEMCVLGIAIYSLVQYYRNK